MKEKNSDFTVREIDVLTFLVNGDSNNVIAEKLCITNHTVNNIIPHPNSKQP